MNLWSLTSGRQIDFSDSILSAKLCYFTQVLKYVLLAHRKVHRDGRKEGGGDTRVDHVSSPAQHSVRLSLL